MVKQSQQFHKEQEIITFLISVLGFVLFLSLLLSFGVGDLKHDTSEETYDKVIDPKKYYIGSSDFNFRERRVYRLGFVDREGMTPKQKQSFAYGYLLARNDVNYSSEETLVSLTIEVDGEKKTKHYKYLEDFPKGDDCYNETKCWIKWKEK